MNKKLHALQLFTGGGFEKVCAFPSKAKPDHLYMKMGGGADILNIDEVTAIRDYLNNYLQNFPVISNLNKDLIEAVDKKNRG